jgi:DNA-cytosine methyltransferase
MNTMTVNEELPESKWSQSVASDPKHRPQVLDKPSTTVRREWARWPQEAHLLDVENNRYRRFTSTEVSIIQGFEPSWIDLPELSERDKIAALGNAVPPPLAKVIFRCISKVWTWQNKTSLEICAGIGGMAIGVEELNDFKHLALIELWTPACEVLRFKKPWPAEIVIEDDVKSFNFKKYKNKIGVFSGGPPCQPWSQAGRHHGQKDPRDILGYLPEMISDCLPEVFVIENVCGLVTNKQNAAYLEDLLDRLESPTNAKTKYGIAKGILVAANYGVPQVRKRLFILGFRGKSHTFASRVFKLIEESASHCNPKLPIADRKPWVTLGEAFKDLQDPGGWRKFNGNVAVNEKDENAILQNNSSVEIETIQNKKQLISIVAGENLGVDDFIRLPKKIEFQWPTKGMIPVSVNGFWDVAIQDEKKKLCPILPNGEELKSYQNFTSHLAILGEQLQALNSLQSHYANSIQMIYFEPPRIDFLPVKDTGLINSIWMSTVRELANECTDLLSKNGFIVVHVEDQTSHYARVVLEEIFGPKNYVCTIVWQKKYGPQNDLNVPTIAQDYLIVFSKNISSELPVIGLPAKDNLKDDGDPRGPWRAGHKGARSGTEEDKFEVNAPPYRWKISKGKLPKGLWRLNEYSGVIWGKPEEAGKFAFTVEVRDASGNVDSSKQTVVVEEDGEIDNEDHVWWLFKDDAAIKSGGKLKLIKQSLPIAIRGKEYSVILKSEGGQPFKGKKSKPGRGRYWEFSRTTITNEILADNVHFGTKGDALPSVKKHSPKDAQRLARIITWWPYQDAGKAEDATRHLSKLAEMGLVSDAPRIAKPEQLLKRLVMLFARDPKKSVLVLGDPTASMTCTAIKLSKHTIHIAGDSDEELNVWENCAKMRILAVLKGEDDLDLGISNDEDVNWSGGGNLEILNVGAPLIYASENDDVIRINFEDYPPQSDKFTESIISLLGFRQQEKNKYFGLNKDGDACVIIPPGESLTEINLAEFATNLAPNYRTLSIVFESTLIADPIKMPENVRLVRIPFDLLKR